MNVKPYLLAENEYYKSSTKKDTIYLHHTAGSHRPDWSIDGWAHDKTASGDHLHVATAYVIGGISTQNKDASFDGIIYKAFEDEFWAHHLGTTLQNNGALNQKSVGIEICNYGPLVKTNDGKFLTYVKNEVPADMVYELTTPFRGFKFYHKYTTAQIQAVKELMLDIAHRHGINLKAGLQPIIKSLGGAMALDVNLQAEKGVPGVWSHSNVLSTKFDLHPQPEMMAMLLSL